MDVTSLQARGRTRYDRAVCKLLHCRLFVALIVIAVTSSPAILAQPEDLDAWSVVASSNITLFSDAEVDRSVEIAVTLEHFRAVFAQLAPAIELEAPAPTRFFAFRNSEAYAPYKTRADRGGSLILGQFLSHPDGNYLTLNADPRYVGGTAVILHEFVHYFVRSNFPDVPLWFNEGLAEYYSTFEADDSSVRVGKPVARHLRWLRERGDFSLADVLNASTGGRAGHGADEVGALYAVSWLLVHHLLSGGPDRLDQTASYLAKVGAGDDPEDAFEEAFDVRLGTLEQRLRDYAQRDDWTSASIPLDHLPAVSVSIDGMAPAEVLVQLGDLVIHLGREQDAERHFQHALDHHPEHPEAHTGLAHVRDRQSRLHEAELLYQDAVRLGSNAALTYLLYGRLLLRSLEAGIEESAAARAERARDLFRRVVEIEPSFAEGHALLGIAHLFGEVDAEAGIGSLRRAIDRVPSRLDWVFRLVQLLLKAEQLDQAEAWVDQVLVERAEPEQVAAAREEIERWRLLQAANKSLEAGEIDDALGLYDQAISVTSDPAMRERMAEKLLALQAQYDR